MVSRRRIAVVYNEPSPSRYDTTGEEKAALGVLESVEAVSRALLEIGYDTINIPLASPIESARKKLKPLKVDLVFNLFEGFCGQPETEAMVPDFLTGLGIAYTGCPASALKVALDKAKSKQVMRAAGIKTPDFQLLTSETLSRFNLSYPCIVKPRSEDASHGLSPASVVSDLRSLAGQVSKVCQFYGGEALVEEFIDGREFNVTVLGNGDGVVLPVSEIVYSLPPDMPRILTFAAKWEPESRYFKETKNTCPAQIPPATQHHITETVRRAFLLMCSRGYARVDMRLDRKGELNVIEVNPNPDISPGSGAVIQAEAAGMNYTRFIDKITRLAFEKDQP
ncbi:MAG: ATP-grasp domain-containing protein [Dehalococcoidales bacterium]|nr:ATP-grasp domain-containing protein [Dehalococcoidales bacterium]